MSSAQSGFPIGQHGTGKGGVVTGQPLTGPPGTDYHYVTSTILRQKKRKTDKQNIKSNEGIADNRLRKTWQTTV